MDVNLEQKPKGGDKRRKGNTGDASIEDIPDEIKIEILSRLPSTSLSRYKCVSRHWNNTLTIQAFLLKHSRSYGKHPKLGFVKRSARWGKTAVISFELNSDNTPKTMIPIVTNPKRSDYGIIGQDVYFAYNFLMNNYFHMSNICNDLICLFNLSSTCVGLLNLKTGDFIHLPPITMKSVKHCILRYALGFDPVRKVFKVLCSIYPNTGIDVVILTVGSKYWKPIDSKSLPRSLINKNSPWRSILNSLCLNGVIYWVHQHIVNPVVIVPTVVAFDLNREALIDNELVAIRLGTYRPYYLTCLKERPTLLIWKTESDETEEVVEQWTLFNQKTPNATWKMRNCTNMMVPC
ncbi:putative F-box protein At1g60370 [Silene latifolia]|uniref:putative F-box protein At1g60370 n=1 Tax=Silene latifolia TaxID=37657 RepID=UPI003D785DC7